MLVIFQSIGSNKRCAKHSVATSCCIALHALFTFDGAPTTRHAALHPTLFTNKTHADKNNTQTIDKCFLSELIVSPKFRSGDCVFISISVDQAFKHLPLKWIAHHLVSPHSGCRGTEFHGHVCYCCWLSLRSLISHRHICHPTTLHSPHSNVMIM